jgi:hypothetical protein
LPFVFVARVVLPPCNAANGGAIAPLIDMVFDLNPALIFDQVVA